MWARAEFDRWETEVTTSQTIRANKVAVEDINSDVADGENNLKKKDRLTDKGKETDVQAETGLKIIEETKSECEKRSS